MNFTLGSINNEVLKGGVVFVCSGLFPFGLVIRGWLVTYVVLRSNGWNPIIPASCLQSLAREEHSHVCLSCQAPRTQSISFGEN